MTECFQTNGSWFNPRQPFSPPKSCAPFRHRVSQSVEWTCPLQLPELQKIMRTILTHFCNTAVVGYDKARGVFWCKKYAKSVCVCHLELALISDASGHTQVHVTPVLCYSDDLEKFVCDFHESVQLYLSSNFIRSILSAH